MFQDVIKYLKREKAICKYCGVFFRRLKNYEKTCCKMSRQPAETSKTCGKKFLQKRYLKEHIKNIHSNKTLHCAGK